MNAPVSANARAIDQTRKKKKNSALKRAEFWVPSDLTAKQKRIIQAWMDAIVEDAKKVEAEQNK